MVLSLSVRSALLVDELGGDVHGIGQRVPDGRLPVDGLLAPADLLFGRRALDRHRVADVRDAVADGLVVTRASPRTSMSASMSMPIASSGTSKRAALVAMPVVTQPASAASSSSGGKGAESTPPSGAGLVARDHEAPRPREEVLAAGRGRRPTVTMALVPRSHVDCTLHGHLPQGGVLAHHPDPGA